MAVALGPRMSAPLAAVLGTLNPFSYTPRGRTCKLRAKVSYDEINSVPLSKHLMKVYCSGCI